MELRRICELVMKLRQQVVDINNNIQFSGREVVLANENFQNVQRVRRNVNLSIEHLESCVPLFQNYIRLQDQLKNAHYYRALKTLHIIENNDLHQIPDKLPLKKFIKDQIPVLKSNVSKQAEILRRNWLEQAR